MISRLRLWQKIFIITAVLGLPLAWITSQYVTLVKELSLNSLNEQLSVLPVLQQLGELAREVQERGANLPLWIIGSDISPNQNRQNVEAITNLARTIDAQMRSMSETDKAQWEMVVTRVRDLLAEQSSNPKSFEAYAEVSRLAINFAKILSIEHKFYSSGSGLTLPSWLAIDLSPSLSEDVNFLRGYITYKAFINEHTLKDVGATSSYLSLAEDRYAEIGQNLRELAAHNPALYDRLQPDVERMDASLKNVRGLVNRYINEETFGEKPEEFFRQSSALIEAIYRFDGILQGYIEAKLKSDIQKRSSNLKVLIGTVALSALLVLALIVYLSRSFVNGIRGIEVLAEQVAGGNRAVEFPRTQSRDEIQAIIAEIEKIYIAIKASEEKSHENNWLLEIKTRLNEVIRGTPDLQRFGEHCLLTLGDVTGATLSTFYLRTDGQLKLAASLGLEAAPQVGLNEGLLASIVRLGRIKHYQSEEIPEGFPAIHSTLGSSPARGLIMFPIKFEGEVIAVAEFLGFQPFTPQILAYLEDLEQTIAVLLQWLKSNLLVMELLAKTRAKSQELLASNIDLANKTQLYNEQRQEAENANRYKSVFLANMSHELRTPLNSIMILAQVLAENRDKNLSEAQIKNSNIIYSSGKDLLKLINEILDLSRIESGKIEITASVIDVRSLIAETQAMYEPLAANKSLSYTVEVQEPLPSTVVSDPIRLAQIIRNFVANAIKFTEEGGVTVRFSAGRPPYVLQVVVSDSGIGMREDQLTEIFEPFKQLNHSLSRKQEGTGLGLAISKNLATKLGADIEVQSELGKGSVFTLNLPAETPLEADTVRSPAASSPVLPALPAAPAVKAASGRPEVSFEGKTILVVDDDIRNVYSLRQILHGRGSEILVASHGQEALEALKEHPHVHLVLMDMMMPEMDGYEAMRRIRNNPQFQNLPIIALTAKAMVNDKQACLAAGASDYFQKPIDPDRLIDLMRYWLNHA